MQNKESLELLKKCESEVKKEISSIKSLLEPMQNPEFKLMVIEGKDQLKEQEEKLEKLLACFQQTPGEEKKAVEMLSKVMTGAKLLLEKTDPHIAGLLFDDCNNSLKILYSAVNFYSCADQSAREQTIQMIQILIDLRENLVAYL